MNIPTYILGVLSLLTLGLLWSCLGTDGCGPGIAGKRCGNGNIQISDDCGDWHDLQDCPSGQCSTSSSDCPGGAVPCCK